MTQSRVRSQVRLFETDQFLSAVECHAPLGRPQLLYATVDFLVLSLLIHEVHQGSSGAKAPLSDAPAASWLKPRPTKQILLTSILRRFPIARESQSQAARIPRTSPATIFVNKALWVAPSGATIQLAPYDKGFSP